MDLISTLRKIGFEVQTLGFDEDDKALAALDRRFNANLAGGWNGWSSDYPYKRFVVFEVGSVLQAQTFKAWALGDGLRFKEVAGSWKGQQNPSFVVEDTSTNRIKLAYWVRGQETLLCLGPAYRKGPDGMSRLYGHREAILDYLESDGYGVMRREPIGLFRPVSRDVALWSDSWTFDPTDRQYYVVQPES